MGNVNCHNQKGGTSRRRLSKQWIQVAISGIVLAATGIVGCVATSSASASTSGAAFAQARKTVDALLVRPTSIGVTEALPTSPPKNKLIVVIVGEIPVLEYQATIIEQGVKALGWRLKVINDDLSATGISTAWQDAVELHPAAVVTTNNATPLITRQLKELKAEGAVAVEYAIENPPTSSLISVLLGPSWTTEMGQLMADYITVNSAGSTDTPTADTVLFTVPTLPPLTTVTTGFQAQYRKDCPSCTLYTEDVPETSIGTNLSTIMVSFLEAHPNVDYIAPTFDDMAIGLPEALKTAGLSSRVKIMGYDPGTDNLSYVSNGEELASITYPDQVVAYRCLDVLVRYFEHQPYSVDSTATWPIQILTKKTSGLAVSHYFAVKNYAQEFYKLWHISP
jgi:ribose transport system substrate-binding protein